MEFLEKVRQAAIAEKIPLKYGDHIEQFYTSYRDAVQRAGDSMENYLALFDRFLELIVEQCRNPFIFEPYHSQVRAPFDYYRFGLDLLRPLIDFERSTLLHPQNLKQLAHQIERGENAILFANHQTEPDPQIISLLLERHYPALASEMIFVAGERVLTDPLAVPLSIGRNLLCIYSKKHIDHPPHQKSEKQRHNQRTIKVMGQLLQQGGKCIYVAPSGGRDRPDSQGKVEVAPFDPDSIEMFRLIASHCGHPTHFYPMALLTYDILPPPNQLQRELGEKRVTKRVAAHLAIGEECPLQLSEQLKQLDKVQRRQYFCDQVFAKVLSDYAKLYAQR